ncbi:MAG: ABC transporter ATP-binding protein [Acidimicrobiales bacterium]
MPSLLAPPPAATSDDGAREHPVPEPVILADDLRKTYGSESEDTVVHALQGVDLRIDRGDYVAIMGASGSGKSTLMHILGCLDVPTSGSYLLDGVDVSTLAGDDLADIRNRKIGFIFQSFNLLPRLDAVGNVELPLAYAGVRSRDRRRRAEAALHLVGLGERMSHRPAQLSGGQQQRVAIARAIATNPAMILADEPTGNLDSHVTADVLEVFARINAAGRTIVLITHEPDVAAQAKRSVVLRDGRIVHDRRQAPLDGPPPPVHRDETGGIVAHVGGVV